MDPEVDSGVHRGQYDECHDDSIAPVSHQQDREGTKGRKIGTVTGDEAIKSPSRVAHHSLDNILFDKESGEVLTVIDLDTVMPGFILSDVGDFIRTAVNTGAEDETDESKIGVDMAIFKSYVEGYMSSASSFLTETEIRLIPYGGRMMTYMQAVRFLTDYINGDTYYKTNYKDHNWDRAWAQYVYLTRLEERAKEMSDFMAHWL